jgi:tRNA-2-methylthio-N6-dimethylallyladenosine synthase
MKKVKFINSYSFIYSERPGTPAAKLKNIDIDVAKKRLKKFQDLSDAIKNEYRQNLVNKKVKVLFENKVKNKNRYFGRDEYNNSVIVESNVDLTGKIKNITIDQFNHNTLFGKIELKDKNIAA